LKEQLVHVIHLVDDLPNVSLDVWLHLFRAGHDAEHDLLYLVHHSVGRVVHPL